LQDAAEGTREGFGRRRQEFDEEADRTRREIRERTEGISQPRSRRRTPIETIDIDDEPPRLPTSAVETIDVDDERAPAQKGAARQGARGAAAVQTHRLQPYTSRYVSRYAKTLKRSIQIPY